MNVFLWNARARNGHVEATLNHPFPAQAFLETILDGLDHEAVLGALCKVGFPGEMFTSAAPQDPTFWPLHGNAERFLQLLRLLMRRGELAIDDAWAYHHVQAASDTHVVRAGKG